MTKKGSFCQSLTTAIEVRIEPVTLPSLHYLWVLPSGAVSAETATELPQTSSVNRVGASSE